MLVKYGEDVFVTPPAIRTLPFGSSVAVGAYRGVPMLPVGVKDLVAGSYSSALERVASATPPTISTLPSLSRVAVWKTRQVVILPVCTKAPGDCAFAP
jgi:hypothetical protein